MYIVKSIKDLHQIFISLNMVDNKPNRSWLSIDKLSLNDNYYFRGQSSKFKSITSSLSRNVNFIKNESKIIEEVLFTRKSDFDTCETPLEIIAKMQHYGIPTRLIDFTKNPLIALFFAVQDDLDYNSNLYICKNSMKENSIDIDVITNLALQDRKNPHELKKIFEDKYSISLSIIEIVDIIDRIVFVNHPLGQNSNNFRLIKQNGVFALCGNEVVEDKILNKIKHIDEDNIMYIITIPKQYKILIKAELDVYFNVNESFVYPELMTYADYIKKKYDSENNIFFVYSQIRELFNKVLKHIFQDMKITILAKLYLLKTSAPTQFNILRTWVYSNELPVRELQTIIHAFLHNEEVPYKHSEWNNYFIKHWVNYEPIDIYNQDMVKYFNFFESIDLAEGILSAKGDATGKCALCGAYFHVPIGEITWYLEKKFNNIYLVQCPDCRRARKQERNNINNNNY